MMVSPTKNKMVKFRYSEKATKVENNLSPFFEIKIKTKIFFFQIFVDFSEYLNFIYYVYV